MGFIFELTRRNVVRVAIAYAIVAWLVIQVADIVLEAIGAPVWVMQTLMLLLALGFIVTAIFAWAYEVTPEGIKRESEVDRSASTTSVTGRKLDRIIIGLLVVSLAYFVWEARFAQRHEDGMPNASAAAEPAAEVVMTPAPELSIAVLPFDNLSALPEDAFFADGIHDDLLTTLAKIGSMKVISRTSVMEYRDTTKKIPAIANELGVANILEGAVQRAGNQVRINVQLIDAATDEHVWAESFDRELTAENLFAIQSEISKAVADALQATLSPEEVKRIDKAPTDNLEAFDHYLRGRVLMAKRTFDDLERATQEFLKAVELDPDFALAWVGIADTRCLVANSELTKSGTHRDTCRHAIDRALEIDPELGQAYASLGLTLMGDGDLSGAEEALRTAMRFSPNYASSYHWLSNMLSFNPVRAKEAMRHAQRAAELDPESAIILVNLAHAYLRFGDYENAARSLGQLVESNPEMPGVHSVFADFHRAKGNLVAAIEEYRKAVDLGPDNPGGLGLLAFAYLDIGAIEEANRIRDLLVERFPGTGWIRPVELLLAFAEGRSADIRLHVTEILEERPEPVVIYYVAAYAALWNSDLDLAYEAFNLAIDGALDRDVSDSVFLDLDTEALCRVAWVLLETDGRESLGNSLVEKSIALYEEELSANVRHPERFGFGLCYLLAGDRERALAELEHQSEQNFTADWWWRLSIPPYDAIRDDPRFVALWDQYEQRKVQQLTELRRRDQT